MDLGDHIRSARSTADARRLGDRLVGACWPGGPADSTSPAALGWVARWRPEKLGATLPGGDCRGGRCGTCN